jgi:hypothetical protein
MFESRLHVQLIAAFLLASSTLSLAAAAQSPADDAPPPVHRVYTHLLEPREHPDDARRFVKPPNWETFGNQTQFAALRGFGVEKDMITGYAEEIEKYTKTYDLGRVVWPSYPIVFAKNIGDLADEIKKRDLFLFDIWGYVPGSGPGDYWMQYKVPVEALATLESTLGDHWLGMDVGEQDGRYIGGYADQAFPVSANRFDQYLNFQRHFERMGDDLGHKLSTLVSLNYGHYFLKEGTYSTIGAETAQALPNNQVYYAFIRGAGKQYGVPWFGNASVFNRWGYKNYDAEGADHSATKGTSLNLLKRLMYTHILYNSVFAGFESGWFAKGELSPIGRIQQSAQKWVRENGNPGVMQTPAALLFDFNAGWTFPRHLYSQHTYRVWGSMPYGPGDYLADHVLDMLYPGYEDASYFHNEAGFMTPTPYGDSADCLLTDAPSWVLQRYPLILVTSELSGGAELRDKLAAYVNGGGILVITAGNVAKFPAGLCGVKTDPNSERMESGAEILGDFGAIQETTPFTLHALEFPPTARVMASCADEPAAISLADGKGRIVVLASAFGISADVITTEPIASKVDAPLPKPYPMLNHVRALLDSVLKERTLFSVGDGLSLVVCRKDAGIYTLGVCNNGLEPKPYAITSHCGPIENVTELPLDQSEKGAVGYLPEGLESAAIGTSGDGIIAGGDVRVFRVKAREEGVEEIPHAIPSAHVPGRILPLHGTRTIKEEVLSRPTFFEHYDSVLVDWRYVHDRSPEALQYEAQWVKRQGLRVYVDLSPGINLYPDLRLVNNDPERYAESMAVVDKVLAGMTVLGAHDLLLSAHRVPENSFTMDQTRQSFQETLKDICTRAAALNITVYLRFSTKLHGSLEEYTRYVADSGAANLFLAPSIAMLTHQKRGPETVSPETQKVVGLWLAGAPAYDAAQEPWTYNAPVRTLPDAARAAQYTSLTPDKPVLFDVVYESLDDEYLDWRFLEGRH